MRGWRKLLAGAVVASGVLATAISATIGWRPFTGPSARPLTDRRFEATPARLARGAYLVRDVAGCLVCHSELDPSIDGLRLALAWKARAAPGGRMVCHGL